MGNKKINQLPSATSVGTGDVTVIYQNGVTKQIPISQIGGGGSSGGGGLQIPEPIVTIAEWNSSAKTNNAKVQYHPISDNSWLNHTPMLFLFRYVGRKRRLDNNNNLRYAGSGFRHPRPFNDRGFIIRNDFGLIHKVDPAQGFNSEWMVPTDLKPYQYMNGFNFNPLEFFRFSNIGGNTGICNPSIFPFETDVNGDNVWATGRRIKGRSSFFEFRFAIRNPNNEEEVIFGPPSNRIMAYQMIKGDHTVSPFKKYSIGIGLKSLGYPVKRLKELMGL